MFLISIYFDDETEKRLRNQNIDWMHRRRKVDSI